MKRGTRENDAAKPAQTETLGRDKTRTSQRSKYCIAKSGIQIGVAFSERWAKCTLLFYSKMMYTREECGLIWRIQINYWS